MKITSFLPVLVAFALTGFTSSSLAAEGKTKTPAKPAKEAKAAPQKSRLQHVVCFKFKETATPEQIKALTDAFGALPKQVKEIKAFEWGTNVSPEKHDKGFTHCFIVTFKTAEDRDTYLVHPAHQEFVKLVGPIVDDVFVIDFWAGK